MAWIVVLTLHQSGILEPFELKTYDHLCRWSAARSIAPDGIALIVVDQGSFDAAQENGIPWPWPREMYDAIVQFCALSGAQAVAFDITYNQPSSYGVEDDQRLAQALRKNGNVLLPILLSTKELPREDWVNGVVSRIGLPLENRSRPVVSVYHSIKVPIRPLAENAAGFGNVTVASDSDGIYRSLPLVFLYDDRWLPVMGLAVVQHLLGNNPLVLDSNTLHVGGIRVPLNNRGSFLLSFYGGQRDFPRYSAFNVIQSFAAMQGGGEPIYPPGTFKDKVVFVGYTAPDLLDLKPTPVSSVYPGIAVHATLVANLLQQDFRVRIQPFSALAMAAGVALVTSLTVMLIASIWQLGFLTLAYGAGLAFFVVLSFRQDLWVDAVLLAVSLGLTFATATAFSYATEGRQRRQIKRMFSHYMSDLLIQDLLKNPDKLRLGGEKRVLTVFFSDLAGFTSICEKLTPEEVVALLNRYLTAMTDIILDSGGLIDKYEGDAIMAFWGAPVPQDDHAVRACLAALDNQRRLADLRREFIDMGLPPIYSRIGINTGEMIIGNMGSSQRFDFTVMGDSVNLAARLEGAGKAYGTSMIISAETYSQAEDRVEVRELDLLQVKGKEIPVRIYELLGRKGELDRATHRLCSLFGSGLSHYRQQEWTDAIRFFERTLEVSSEDGPSKVFIDRCHEFIKTPPLSGWDGVYRLTTK